MLLREKLESTLLQAGRGSQQPAEEEPEDPEVCTASDFTTNRQRELATKVDCILTSLNV